MMPGPAPDWLFKYGTCSRLHIQNVIYNIFLCLTCRGATSIPWDREKHALESYFTQTSPETTWFDKKRTPMRYGKNQDKLRKNPDWSKKNPDKVRQVPRQIQKEPGSIIKQPRRGAASTKTNSGRTRIDQKTTRIRYIQVQKEPGRSANNLEEVHQEPEKSRNDLDE